MCHRADPIVYTAPPYHLKSKQARLWGLASYLMVLLRALNCASVMSGSARLPPGCDSDIHFGCPLRLVPPTHSCESLLKDSRCNCICCASARTGKPCLCHAKRTQNQHASSIIVHLQREGIFLNYMDLSSVRGICTSCMSHVVEDIVRFMADMYQVYPKHRAMV